MRGNCTSGIAPGNRRSYGGGCENIYLRNVALIYKCIYTMMHDHLG